MNENKGSINLVRILNDFFIDNIYCALDCYEIKEWYSIVMASIDTLIDFTTGPCREN